MTDREYEQLKVDAYNREPGELGGADCPICHNKGRYMILTDDNEIRIRECRCMAQRRSLQYLERSGLSKVLDVYTWDRWECRERWQEALKERAMDYAKNPEGWMIISGRPGTGKTHICTAVCGDLLKAGYEVRYLLWRDFTTRAKAVINDSVAYSGMMGTYKTVPVLYLDDLFKTGGKTSEPTTGDCNLAFELLNARYADPDKLTIISSELNVDRILSIDEAVGSRIFERAKNHCMDLSDRQNWRLVH